MVFGSLTKRQQVVGQGSGIELQCLYMKKTLLEAGIFIYLIVKWYVCNKWLGFHIAVIRVVFVPFLFGHIGTHKTVVLTYTDVWCLPAPYLLATTTQIHLSGHPVQMFSPHAQINAHWRLNWTPYEKLEWKCPELNHPKSVKIHHDGVKPPEHSMLTAEWMWVSKRTINLWVIL